MGMFGSFLGGSDNKAQKEIQKDNAKRQAFLEQQALLARGDSMGLYPQGDYARNTTYNDALALLGQSAPVDLSMYQNGNVAAQNIYAAGMPQYQNAVLGMPVNNAAIQPYVGMMPNASMYQTQLPDFGTVSSSQAPPAASLTWQQPQPAPQAAPQQQQMNPQQMMQMANTYNNVAPMWGGTPLWGGAASGGSAAAGSAPIAAGAGQASATGLSGAVGAGQVGGAGAAGGGGGAGGAMAAAGPWAALAAAIAGWEHYQNKSDNRPDDKKDYWGEVLSGKVSERDAKRYFGKNGEKLVSYSTPHGAYNHIKEAPGKVKDAPFKPWKWF